MITLEMCLEYLKHPKYEFMFKDTYPSWLRPPIVLTEAQQKFLGNLCEGKLTNTPRCFGKTLIIKLYCECLDYYTDSIKWAETIPDDYISLQETIKSCRDTFGFSPYSERQISEALKANQEKAMQEYNFNKYDLEGLCGEQN